SFYHLKGDYETKIIKAYSISEEGEISYLQEKDITYTTPSQGLSFFSGRKDAQIIKASIPNVKVGSIIDYEWETVEKSPEDPVQFYTNWYFGGENPVFESKVKFIVPEEKEFYYVIKNFGDSKYDGTLSKEDGYKIYSFRRGECPPFIEEPYSPPSSELLPFVQGSSFKNQDYLSEWLSKLFEERMVYDDKIKITVNDILNKSKAKSEEEIISTLYRFTQEYIKYLSIKTSLSSGFSGHKATETFYNRYGDCIDKSIFFATILNLVGIEAYPVIVTTNDQKQPLFGELGLVSGNHAINEIHLKDKKKIIYLDTTSTTYKYPYFREDDHNIKAWNPILNKFNFILPPLPEENCQIFNTTINLDKAGGGEIIKSNVYSGSWEAGLREYLASLKDVEKKAVFSQIAAKEHPGSVLKDFKHSDPADYNSNFGFDFTYEAKEIAKKSGDFLILNLPSRYDFSYATYESRNHPIKFSSTYEDKNKFEIIIPEGLKIKGNLKNVEIKNDFFTYKADYKVEKNKLTIYSTFSRSKCYVPKENYKDLRKDLFKVDKILKSPIIFQSSL
ncbi:MAG TPA: DUF3857 and transglutaminase domain-containing protein, partial [Spirochaetota bacterium]|nr:DUF3857 and transglutaminase domain-containing protein [Spirochaetota bacterium]